MDDEGSAQLATRHLIDLGHRRIGFIAGSPEYNLSGWRVDGWREEMEAAGLADEALLAWGDFSYASGEAAARTLLDSAAPPTAIIVRNDQMTTATPEVARARDPGHPATLSVRTFPQN